MDVLQNMMLLSELVQCGGNVYTWCYDAQGKLLRSNCPDEAFLASGMMCPLPWGRLWVFCGEQPLKRKRKS